MIWLILIIVVIGSILLISKQKNDSEVEQENLSKGGMRKTFPTFTNYIETFYEMKFINDTGRNFTFGKNIYDSNNNLGKLIIGVKYDIKNELVLFSKFESKFKGEFQGLNVTGIDFDNIASIERCINISIDKIKSNGVIGYQDTENGIKNQSIPSSFLEDWNNLGQSFEDDNLSAVISDFTNSFYIPDRICQKLYLENIDILNNKWKVIEENYGTKSIREIEYLPPSFSMLFVAAYPDVYLWYQENAPNGNVIAHNKLETLSDEEAKEYLQDHESILEFYREIIDQFLEEGNILETRL